jgi:hypothetical protein
MLKITCKNNRQIYYSQCLGCVSRGKTHQLECAFSSVVHIASASFWINLPLQCERMKARGCDKTL